MADKEDVNQCMLFVYGSMKKSFMNHIRLESARYIGTALTQESYSMYPALSYKFPYVLEADKVHQIKGELYQVSDELLKIVDIFEGHPEYYVRKQIKVISNNKVIDSYIFFLQN